MKRSVVSLASSLLSSAQSFPSASRTLAATAAESIAQRAALCSLITHRQSLSTVAASRAGLEAAATTDSQAIRKRPFYLDYQATTPMDPRVMDKMLPLMVDAFGNPHSRTHAYGWEAEELVEDARRNIAQLIGAQDKEIIFTSGATESNNLSIKGVASFYGTKKKHIITTQIEHKCVLASCRDLEVKGFEVTYLPVNTEGLIDVNELKKAIREDTLLVTIMMVNNEIGVVQPIREIGDVCKERNIIFHSDAAQAVGKISIDVTRLGVDLMSMSGHKIYGPKGVGALYVRMKRPRIRLVPLISGGGQEKGLRSGTLPAPLCVGLGEACRLAQKEMLNDQKHVAMLEKRLYDGITSKLDAVVRNGSETQRYRGNLNLSFAAVEGESLLMSLKDIAVSSGSACTSASLEPSYVLRAIGVDEALAHTSLRFGFGRFTTIEEVDQCIEMVIEHVQRLREISPLWELRRMQEKGLPEGDQDKPVPVWT